MAECSFARCQQERRAIRKELQRWTKNMVYILGRPNIGRVERGGFRPVEDCIGRRSAQASRLSSAKQPVATRPACTNATSPLLNY
ncbi:unnamed protein product [Leptosia nina]|uniref:Uncharacterized protein n=1 Tax=Leptosia nina TaxID=320188 RepID=A0AAV1IYC2_9NEOP